MRFLIPLVKLIATVLVLVFIVSGVSYWYLMARTDTAHGLQTENQRFVVRPGENVASVADRLQAAGIIDGRLTFILYALRTGLYKQFQVGEYSLSGALDIPTIVQRMVEGKVVPAGVRVTFPEGWTMDEMAARLTETGLAGNDFLEIAKQPFPKWEERYSFLRGRPAQSSLEGYLFPDTYIFPPQATGELIVNELLKNFQAKAEPVILAGLSAHKLSFHEILTLASLIEEEGRTESDRQNISDVFRKRLLIGQPLQSDATINYIHNTAKDQPTFEDLKSTSPYNTYAYPGLPPGPIGNPSLMSIRAALYPTSNPYYYFLIDLKSRTTYFAEDFAGHQRNRTEHGL